MVPAPELSRATPEQLVRHVEWTVLKRLDGRLQGDYRTIFRGTGIDLRDLREYEPGDDLRHIDWNVTARTDTPHVRQHAEDRELTAWLLVDRSASMSFGAAGRPKHRVLAELVVLLSAVLSRGGNRIGAVLFGDGQQRVIPPRQGRTQVLRLAHEVLADAQPQGGPTDLHALLRSTVGLARQRSLVVLVSDFVSTPGWQAPLTRLAQRHDVLVVQLVDPAERDLPEAGLLALTDPETGEQVLVDSSDPVFRRRLAELGAEQDARLEADVRSAGVLLHRIRVDEDLAAALLRISRLRAVGRR